MKNNLSPLVPAAPGWASRAAFRFLAGAAITAAILATGAAAPPPTAAQIAQAVPSGTVTVDVNKAQVIFLPNAAKAVFIANPDVADVQAHDAHRVIVFGKKAGSTTAYVFLPGGQLQGYTITVKGATGDVSTAVRAQAPGARVEVTGQPNGMTVMGSATSPQEAADIKAAVQQYLGEKDKMVFEVPVAGSTQVNLQVRVAEVNRVASKDLGFNWDALANNGTVAVGLITGRQTVNFDSSGNPIFGQFIRDPSTTGLSSIGIGYKKGVFNINGLIDALQEEGMATLLAEPNLTAISGESASFLAGGEFPVPVSQGLQQVTIEWKKFGVSLDFTPTVLSGDRISIKVRPEVSQLSEQGAVVVNNIKIPGITVRRAETTVELASGQSFAIAGLFQNSSQNDVKQYPWLGDIPVLGTLFRSSTYQRNESELVIIVTPYIVQPAASPNDLHLPTENVTLSNDVERILEGKTIATGTRPHLTGPAGFMLEDKR